MNGDRQGTLTDHSAPNWFELDRDPRATLVKTSHFRRTWRVRLGDGEIFAKVFDAQRVNPFSRITHRLGLGAAQREWRASQAAQWRGVPAVRCLALGVERKRRGAMVLLSGALPDAISLSEAWKRGASCRATALSLIEAVARLFASAHNRGFVHRDAHPSNILMKSTDDAGWEASYVDLQGARFFNNTASRRCAVRSLAQLDHFFQRRATRSQRWRFLQRYVSLRRSFFVRGERRTFYRRLLTSIAGARAAHATALARQRDRRIHRNGKYFATISLGNGWKGTFVLRLERRHVFPESGVSDRSKRDWTVMLGPIVNEVDGASLGHGLQMDRSRPAGTWTRLLWSLAGSPQRKEFNQSHRLRHRDVPASLILAYLEHRGRTGLIDEGILVRVSAHGES